MSNHPTDHRASDCFVVRVSQDPSIIAGTCRLKTEVLEDIFDWIRLNLEALKNIDSVLSSGGDATDIIASLERLQPPSEE